MEEIPDMNVYQLENGDYVYRDYQLSETLNGYECINFYRKVSFRAKDLKSAINYIDKREAENERLHLQLLCNTISFSA